MGRAGSSQASGSSPGRIARGSVQVCPGPGCCADAHSPEGMFCRIPQQGLFLPVLSKQGPFLTAGISLDYSSAWPASAFSWPCEGHLTGLARGVGRKQVAHVQRLSLQRLVLEKWAICWIKVSFFFPLGIIWSFFFYDNVELNWRVVHTWIYLMMRS